MVRISYLRVYQPLEAFRLEERHYWSSQGDRQAGREPAAPRRWLMTATLPASEHAGSPEGAFFRQVEGRTFVCPFRTRLRMLSGLLAFRGSIPEEAAEAFVPESSARHAAQELAALCRDQPGVRSHILHSNWHVPLRWFAVFDASERILVEDRRGLRIRYETALPQAKARAGRALDVLEDAGIDEGVTEAVRELFEWLEQFQGEGLVELDYGAVAGSFSDDDLVEDRSAAEVWSCLDALADGDLVHAGRVFTSLSERWGAARVSELVN